MSRPATDRVPPTISPQDWGLPPAAVETHISVLTFIGDRAFKLHKPIRTAFLDHSTRAQRQRACHEELAVNRRFAPDVYLGVLDVMAEHGPEEHLIAMRRMPAERQLSRILHYDEARECLRAVAGQVAEAHRVMPPIRERGLGDWRQLRQLWQDGLTQMAPFADELVPADQLVSIGRLARRYLSGRRPLFSSRVEDGRVRDGHGDLLADDIYCLPDGPRILDALAFDRRLRIGDTLSDAAFLAMDVESRGHPELADGFLGSYAELSGDHYPISLAHHYLAYRAFVRAKIACLAAQQGRAAKAARARELLRLTEAHLEEAQVRIVLVGGAPGTGKTTLAEGLAAETGWQLMRTDVTRKTLSDLEPEAPAEEAYQRGLYDPRVTDVVYGSLIDSARQLATLGHSVVLDASWSRHDHRSEVRAMAAAVGADLLELRCELPAELAGQRIAERRRAGHDASDATVEIAGRMRRSFEPWPTATRLDASGSKSEVLRDAARALGVALPAPRWGSSTEHAGSQAALRTPEAALA